MPWHAGAMKRIGIWAFYAVGTLANIVQSVKLPDGNIKVLVEGVERARALSINTEEGFFRANLRLIRRAIRAGWPIPEDKRRALVEHLEAVATAGNARNAIAAAWCLLAADRVNRQLESERERTQ